MSQKNGVDKVFLIGRSSQDSQLEFTSSGKPVANFSLVVDGSFVDIGAVKNFVASRPKVSQFSFNDPRQGFADLNLTAFIPMSGRF